MLFLGNRLPLLSNALLSMCARIETAVAADVCIRMLYLCVRFTVGCTL